MGQATQQSSSIFKPISETDASVGENVRADDLRQDFGKFKPDIPTVHTERSLKECRRAGRLVALQTKPEEQRELTETHRRLVYKRLMEGLTREEESQLKMIRWEMDTVQDALSGAHMESTEAWIESSEQFANDIESLIKEATAIASNKPRTRTK